MLKKSVCLIIAALFVFSMVLSGCSGAGTSTDATTAATTKAADATTAAAATTAAKEVKAGFIYVGSAGDAGWTWAHDQGRLFLEKETGIKTVIKENVPESAEVEKVMNDMIDQGCNVIFATSFGYMDYVEKVAKLHPDVIFFHCSGYKSADNFANYFGRMYQARYLSGIVAGLKTKSNKIGYVAAFSIPEVVNGIDSFTLGVRSVNPNAKVYVRWTHTWFDPAKEKDAAKALLDEGCDITAQHQDSTGAEIAAQEKGAFCVGYDSDSSAAVPKAFLTAPVWNWGPYYVGQIKAIQAGTWKTNNYFGGMDEGIVGLAPLTANCAPGSQEAVDKAKAKILDGSFKVFEGPIKDQTGAVKIEQGKSLSDADINSLNWFVEGVEGTIEK